VQWDVVALSVKPSLVYGEEDTILLSSLRQVSGSQTDLLSMLGACWRSGRGVEALLCSQEISVGKY
jgi:hypothetical protein